MNDRRYRRLVAAAVALGALVAACGGDDDADDPGLLVGRIDDAIADVEDAFGGPQDYFEISATADRVILIVAVDGATAAEQAFWSVDEGLLGPEAVGPASGATFRAAALDFDSGAVLGQVDDELPDAEIVDFAITGGPDGSVIYDASVQSAQGGVLLVRLGAQGQILGVQAR